MKSSFKIWGFDIPVEQVTTVESQYLNTLPKQRPTVEWVWQEMDSIWRKQGLDNKKPLIKQKIGEYYSHPVWLVNGIFTAKDPISAAHRLAIAIYIRDIGLEKIADYGGGFGELALAISNIFPLAKISIVEPFPTKFGTYRLKNKININMVSSLGVGYDLVIAQDVLEHVEDPVKLAFNIASATREKGYIIFANCFHPVIQCHLPCTFHLRHTFIWLMKKMGLDYVGEVAGAPHAHVFRRRSSLRLNRARFYESISKIIGPMINYVARLKSYIL